jgi:hypothetical protein
LPTHHPEKEDINVLMVKAKAVILRMSVEKKRNREWHGTTYNERFGKSGHYIVG